jgi:benzoate/toluate 1,2-dioxygenase alpha subunit
MMASTAGGNAHSDRIGMEAVAHVLGTAQLCDETLYHSYYREWAKRMEGALA